MHMMSLEDLMNAVAPQGQRTNGVKSRVKHAHAFVCLMRSTGVIHIAEGLLPPIERQISEPERRAYNSALELLANFFSGEITVDGPGDEDLPGEDLAVKFPPAPPTPEAAAPAAKQAGPVMVVSGGRIG